MFNNLFKGFRKERCLLGNIGQWLGVVLMTLGFFIATVQKSPVIWQILTAGCIIFSMATKLKHEGRH